MDREQSSILTRKFLAAICILFVALAWGYGLVLPPFENLDEVEHFSAIRYVADTGSLPVHDAVIQETYLYRQEASQPPLYYIVLGTLTRLLGLPTDDTNNYLVSNPFVACGPSDQPYNRHSLYHNPSLETFSFDKLGTPPWDGALLTLHILRALTPILQIFTIVGVYAIARLVLPQHPAVALLASALTAFNPQFISVASGVNNDNVVTPLVTLGLYLALLTRQRGLSPGRSLALGLLTGLAGLAKLSGLLLLGFTGLILLEIAWRSCSTYRSGSAALGARCRRSISMECHRDSAAVVQRCPEGSAESRPAFKSSQRRDVPHVQGTQRARILGHGLLIGGVTLAVCGWWYWRNWQLYGDPTALEPMLEWVGQREAFALPLNESGLMFRSFWGQLACAFFRDWFYGFFGLLTAVGSVGLLLGALVGWRDGRKDSQSWKGMFLLAIWFGIVFIGWLRWGSITAATGGRLLFPAIASTSTLLGYGLLRPWPVAWRSRVAGGGVVLLATIALATLLGELRPLFASPRIYAKADAPRISHPLEATFGFAPQIGLLGYDAEIDGALPLSYLDVTLYWQALAPISQDYALAIQLTSPVSGDDSLRFNYNTWPGRGNYPTTAWSPDRVIADHYRFKLPASDAATQAWQLLVAFYERESGDRLPVRLNNRDIGKGLALKTLRVPGLVPNCTEEMILEEPAVFGQADLDFVSLSGASVNPTIVGPYPGIQVALCWTSLATIPLDYTVFVHLYDGNGELLATGDGLPMNGAFPTQLWQPGDVIADLHFIPLNDQWDPGGMGSYRVGIGLYNPVNGERLGAVQVGQPARNDIVLLNID